MRDDAGFGETSTSNPAFQVQVHGFKQAQGESFHPSIFAVVKKKQRSYGTTVDGSEIRCSPVEVGSLSTMICKVLYIPAGDRQISESSSSMSPKKPDHSVSNEPKWTISGGYLCDNVGYSHPSTWRSLNLYGRGCNPASVLGFNCTDFVWWFRGPSRCFNS